MRACFCIKLELVPNATPFIDFGLNLLATGRVELTIRISVVLRPLNFLFFNRVSHSLIKGIELDLCYQNQNVRLVRVSKIECV